MATKYEILADEKVVDTKSSKTTAIALAEKLRATEKVGVQVRTSAGTTVFEMKAPKLRVITKRTPRYTRLDALRRLPDAQVPAGYEIAYVRERKGATILRKHTDEGYVYALFQAQTAELLEGLPTTRACGRLLADGKFPTLPIPVASA